ncbi:MAG: AraC family transcriptional regulator [Clostridiales bacterium]|nr:AraC family transcriptional regulator [Clostridiales bacterium]
MLKIFWDKDNIAFIGNRVNATEHAHCVLQVFLSFDEPLSVTVENEQIGGKCIIVGANARHKFSCENAKRLSILIEPSSGFAKELTKKIKGNFLVCDSDIEPLQQKAAALLDTNDKQPYIDFIDDFAKFLGIQRHAQVLDERIAALLELLQNCDCYDHTIESLAESVCLSSSRLSHLFREQIGVPLKSYLLFHQLERAFTALLSGKSMTDAAMLAGFDSPSHFAATVKKWMGMPAGASRKDSEFLKVFM